ncbi:hypothetical protein STEG23_012152 [Scotinomys teguina]
MSLSRCCSFLISIEKIQVLVGQSQSLHSLERWTGSEEPPPGTCSRVPAPATETGTEEPRLLAAPSSGYGQQDSGNPLPHICLDKAGVFSSSWTGVFSSCCLALDSSSSFPCPAFGAIAKSDMQVSTTKFMLLYAWYSWPNVVLCFWVAFDRPDIWNTVIFALGGIFNAFWLMEFGRFVFGIGGESLAVAQNTYAVSWFKGKELNLVFGLQLSMARIGSTVNMNLMGWLYPKIEASVGSAGHMTLGVTLMIGGVTCVLSLICALVLAYLDRRAEKILHREQGKTGEVIKLTDIKDFSLPLWLVFLICVCYYVAVFPFIGLGKVFFIEKFGFSSQSASAINSVVYIISAPMSPVFGLLVDKTGKNVIWVLCAVATTLVSHMMLAFTFWNPWIAMVYEELEDNLLI